MTCDFLINCHKFDVKLQQGQRKFVNTFDVEVKVFWFFYQPSHLEAKEWTEWDINTQWLEITHTYGTPNGWTLVVNIGPTNPKHVVLLLVMVLNLMVIGQFQDVK